MNQNRNIYEINIEDIQTVATEVLDRNLTEKEIALVEKFVGEHIDWFQAIENAIYEHIHE